jgi:hypothetical protein
MADLTLTETSRKADRTALRRAHFFLAIAVLNFAIALMTSTTIGDVFSVTVLNMLCAALMTAGPVVDRWRVGAHERTFQEASSLQPSWPQRVICEPSKFLMGWYAFVGVGLAAIGTGLLVNYRYRLTADQYQVEHSDLISTQALLIFFIVIWLAAPALHGWFRGRNRLILDRDGLHLSGRGLSFAWSDIAHTRLRQSNASIMLRLSLVGDALIANRRRAARRLFNPEALDEDEVLITISGLDKSAATIIDYIRTARTGPLRPDLKD